jgi:hypothetical protein
MAGYLDLQPRFGGPALACSVVKTFFRWAHSIDLIPTDVSSELKSLPIVRKQVQPLTRDEMASLLTATSQCGFAREIVELVRLFILLQRWSGLACAAARRNQSGRRKGLREGCLRNCFEMGQIMAFWFWQRPCRTRPVPWLWNACRIRSQQRQLPV